MVARVSRKTRVGGSGLFRIIFMRGCTRTRTYFISLLCNCGWLCNVLTESFVVHSALNCASAGSVSFRLGITNHLQSSVRSVDLRLCHRRLVFAKRSLLRAAAASVWPVAPYCLWPFSVFV